MENEYRKQIKNNIKVVQRDLSKLDVLVKNATKVNDGKLNIPIGNMDNRISLIFKLKKLRNKLKGLQ